MLNWRIEELHLPLVYNWKISRNESTFKRNFIITVSDGKFEGKGEVAPNIRYGELPENITTVFNGLHQDLTKTNTLEDITYLLNNKVNIMSLRFGLESAFIHYLASKTGQSVYGFFGLGTPSPVETSYTLPIMEIGEVKDFIFKYNLHRFSTLKVKINQESGFDLLQVVVKHYQGPLRIDANESWQDVDSLLVMFEKCQQFPIQFFEQPLPSTHELEYKYLKAKSPFELIGDESITNNAAMDSIAQQFHGVNMKLMKAGGYLNGIKILTAAKKHGLKTMIGCMVETTLGIFSAINLSSHINYLDLDGHFLVENEPFKIVSEKDGKLFI